MPLPAPAACRIGVPFGRPKGIPFGCKKLATTPLSVIDNPAGHGQTPPASFKLPAFRPLLKSKKPWPNM
jgi:hypothetical protein